MKRTLAGSLTAKEMGRNSWVVAANAENVGRGGLPRGPRPLGAIGSRASNRTTLPHLRWVTRYLAAPRGGARLLARHVRAHPCAGVTAPVIAHDRFHRTSPRQAPSCSSAGWPEIGLDAVARLHALERLLRGLELVDLAVGLLDRHLPGGRVNLHDPAFDFLRSTRLGLLVGRAEIRRGLAHGDASSQEGDGDEACGNRAQHLHSDVSLLVGKVVDRTCRRAHARADQ